MFIWFIDIQNLCMNQQSEPSTALPSLTPIVKRTMSQLILQFLKVQQLLRQKIKFIDEAILDIDDDNYSNNLLKGIESEQKLYKNYCKIYQQMDSKAKKLYSSKISQIEEKINEHMELFQSHEANPDAFRNYTKEKIYLSSRMQEDEWIYLIRGWFGILGAFCLHLLIGAIYRWPMINVYATSFYKITNDPELTNNENSVGTPIFMFSVGLTMKYGLHLAKSIGKIPLFVVSVSMLTIVLHIAHLMPSFLLFIFFHNFLFGIFAGLMFLTTLSQCQKYFAEYALLVNSIILVGTGLGGVLFGAMNTRCMNPNLFLPAGSGYFSGALNQIAYRLPPCIKQMSWVVGGIGLFGVICLWRLCRYNDAVETTNQQIKWPAYFEFSCYNEEEALSSGVFWKIIGLIILCSEGNFFMAMNYSKIPNPQITDQGFLELVVMANGVANGIFRFIWGSVLRQFGFKYTFLIVVSLNIVCFITISWTVLAPSLYLVSFFISGACLGGMMVMIPNLCLLVFGDKIGNEMYSYCWAAFCFANLIQYFMGVHLSSGIQYVNQFKIFCATTIIGLVLGITTKYQGRWENSLQKLTF